MVRTVVGTGAVVTALALGLGAAAGIGADGPGTRAGTGRTAASADVAAVAPDPAGDHPRPLAVPLDPPVVVARAFDGPPHPWAAGHRGVDLAAHPGQAVRSPGGGVVVFAGTVVDRGVVTVEHADGLRSSLEPVQWSVERGRPVLRGQVLGSVAAVPGHCAPATCLHWGLRRGEAYLDPMRWVLGRGPVVLLPRD